MSAEISAVLLCKEVLTKELIDKFCSVEVSEYDGMLCTTDEILESETVIGEYYCYRVTLSSTQIWDKLYGVPELGNKLVVVENNDCGSDNAAFLYVDCVKKDFDSIGYIYNYESWLDSRDMEDVKEVCHELNLGLMQLESIHKMLLK